MRTGVHGAAQPAVKLFLLLAISVFLAGCSGGGGKGRSDPAISAVSPAEARTGETIRVSGRGFGSTQGQVFQNGTALAGIQAWSSTEIRVTLPAGATTGPVTVRVGSRTSNAVNLVVLPPPAISGIDPNQGGVGDTFRITGTGFGDTQDGSSVSLNGVTVTAIQAWSDTEIEATVPDATSGPVTVTVGSTTSNSVDFTVLPVISAVSPAEAKAGETVLVTGSGFGSTQGGSTITINGIAVSAIESWSSTEIEATVPDGAASGDVIVTVGSTDSNAIRLVVPWTPQNPDNVRASSKDHAMQQRVQMVSDGSGGAIIVWEDIRLGSRRSRIYTQRIDRKGECQWGFGCGPGGTAPNGVPVAEPPPDDLTGGQTGPRLISDGNGGAIVIWQDRRNFATTGVDIYAQRIDSFGQPVWPEDMVVSVARSDQSYAGSSSGVFSQRVPPELVSDGNGGAIVVWQDDRDSGTTGVDIYAQRINADGERQWENGPGSLDFDGIPVSTAAHRQHVPKLISDGNGGAILVWEDLAPDPSIDDHRLRMQRLSADGEAQWASDGIELVRFQLAGDIHPYLEASPHLISDGIGGAIVVWRDRRSQGTTQSNINAQRVDADGQRLWENGTGSGDYDGMPVSVASGNQTYPKIVDDGSNGAIVVWVDNRDETRPYLFAQRLNADGLRQWENGAGSGDYEGVPVTTYTTANNNDEYNARMVADGFGGAIIAWEERRDSDFTGVDIYAQKLNASGVRLWENGVSPNTHVLTPGSYVPNFDGVPISNDTDASGVVVRNSNPHYNQRWPELVADGDGGAVIGWSDARGDKGYAVYVQGVTTSGRQ